MCKVRFKAMDSLLGICCFNGANNWQWNNSKWNHDSSFLVLVGHLYGFSRKCCQLLQSVVALKTAAPTRSSSSGLGSQRWQAGLTRYITSSYISTHDASLFLWELSHHHDMKLFKRNTTQSRSREGLRLQPLGCTEDLPVKNRSTKEVNTTDLADGT